MSVAAQTPYRLATGNGASTVYPYNFQILASGDLAVYIDGSLKVLNVDYTVSGVGVQTGGNVTFVTAPANATRVTISRTMLKQRPTDYQQAGDFLTTTVNPDFDRAILIAQELDATAARSLRAAPYEQGSNLLLAPIATRKNNYLYFDANGDAAYAAALASGTLSQSTIAGFLNPITTPEISAGATIVKAWYPEGDIRRYGADTALSDNSSYINMALSVSSAGGAPAFIPGGTWKITSTMSAPGGSSMYGVGQTSIINPNTCDGLTFQPQGAYAGTRFFRDFMITGTTTTANNAIICNFSAASGNRITQVQFVNLTIQNFQQAVYARGIWNSVFRDCWLYNNYQGFLFTGQNIQTQVRGGFCQKGALAGAGTQYGILVNSVAGESTQSLHLLAWGVYGYDTNICLGLAFYTVIEGCDISTAQTNGIQLITLQAGVVIRDCWIQTLNGAVGTRGIAIEDRGSISNDKTVIDGCVIVCNTANAGSIGIYCGSLQQNITITKCTIGQSNTPWATGISCSTAHGMTEYDNAFYVTGTARIINSLARDMSCGPDYLEPGAAQVATMANATANIGVTDSTKFYVGQPVTFDAGVNGVLLGATYYVLSAAANVITVSTVSGGGALVMTGNTAVNVTPQILPISFTSGTPAGFRYTARGGIHFILSGMASGGTGLLSWFANGGSVSLTVPSAGILGVSNLNSMVSLALPVELRPVSTRSPICRIQDNSVNGVGLISLAVGGVLTFFKDVTATAMTNANNKGLVDTVRYDYAA